MQTPVILAAARTPTGKFLGALKGFTAPELGAIAIREALARAGVDPADVDECLMGNVVSAGEGQAPARQAALGAGLPDTVGALTLNMVCGSGLRAVMLAAQGIQAGDVNVAVAGGMESMSNTPYALPRMREGVRMGNAEILDLMIHDGLWCAFEHWHMGNSGEVVASEYHVTREDQDRYAAESHHRAAAATAAGWFRDEIVPITIPQKKGEPIRVDSDEPIRPDTTVEALAKLKPAFKKDGTVTAGQRARRERRRRSARRVVRRVGGRARQAPDRAHRRAGRQRAGAEARVDDTGRGRPQGHEEGRLVARRRSI